MEKSTGRRSRRWGGGSTARTRRPSAWAPATDEAELRPGEIHVYRTRLDATPEDVRALRTALSPEERDRLDRPEGDATVDELASRAALRLLLARYLGLEPAGLPLRGGADGPGSLDGDVGIRFDHARSGRLGIYAISRSSSVGVHVERVRRLDEMEPEGDPLSSDSFSVVERETLRALPEGLRAEGFFQCRTRKRALLRAADGELPCALSDLDVSVTPGVPPRIYRWRRTEGPPDEWTLLHLRPGPRHVGAVAVPDRVSGLRLWSWSADASARSDDGR